MPVLSDALGSVRRCHCLCDVRMSADMPLASGFIDTDQSRRSMVSVAVTNCSQDDSCLILILRPIKPMFLDHLFSTCTHLYYPPCLVLSSPFLPFILSKPRVS